MLEHGWRADLRKNLKVCFWPVGTKRDISETIDIKVNQSESINQSIIICFNWPK